MARVRVQCPYEGCDGMDEFETDPESEVIAREKGHSRSIDSRKSASNCSRAPS
ncbi:hypothetical protein [Haladaptatus sp. W1]|uniref:hypothetical protein n=1 Tax=Haladaptatus sp. W1 TaxID=1897478 RepID=UPI0020C7EC10|nr:hypothetical protein [Haladaptatus sp. W1]